MTGCGCHGINMYTLPSVIKTIVLCTSISWAALSHLACLFISSFQQAIKKANEDFPCNFSPLSRSQSMLIGYVRGPRLTPYESMSNYRNQEKSQFCAQSLHSICWNSILEINGNLGSNGRLFLTEHGPFLCHTSHPERSYVLTGLRLNGFGSVGKPVWSIQLNPHDV